MKGKRLAMLKPNSSGQKEVHSQMERNSTNEDGHEERPMCRRSAKHFRIPKMKRYFKRGKKKVSYLQRCANQADISQAGPRETMSFPFKF